MRHTACGHTKEDSKLHLLFLADIVVLAAHVLMENI